jgi:succinate-acetate transporter protein
MSERELSNSAVWAVTAFTTTSFMLGIYNAGLLNLGGLPLVMIVAVIFGGLMQTIVAVLECVRGNTFTTTVFGSYGPFWIALGTYNLLFKNAIPAAAVPSAVSLFLAMFAVITFYFFIASFKTDAVLIVIFALIDAALILLAIGTATGMSALNVIGGWVTIMARYFFSLEKAA